MNRNGYTLIDLMAVTFVITVTIAAWKFTASLYGLWWGIGAGFLAGILSIALIISFYRWDSRRTKRILAELRDRYTGIYRIKIVPSNPQVIILPEGAEIRLGDFGWEAGPIRDDGLIYLQGLTPDWTVVWHAGFRPDEIEMVSEKPYSQYDSWYTYWASTKLLPPCPFTVIERTTMTVGRPHYSHRYFEIPAQYRPKVNN